MKPVVVSTDVPQSCEEVFEFLDVLANHERFTNHMLVDWSCSGPVAGIGAKARMRFKAPGKPQWIDMTAIVSERPHKTIEESVSADGRRRTRGTYTLSPTPNGGTHIEFELKWVQPTRIDRTLAPLIRAQMKSANAKTMRRLNELLAQRAAPRPPGQASGPRTHTG